VWLRYDEATIRGPAPGFENCRVDDQNDRIAETFAIEVGEPPAGVHGALSIAARSVDASNARAAFNPGAAKVYDESIPYQRFPDGKLPYWLIPIGYVRWQKLTGQPGRIIARNDKGKPPDSDRIRAFRRYIGVVVESLHAADGVIRMRDRWTDPDPAKTFFNTPQATVDPKHPSVNDLVWIEGHMRVLGDTRISGGKLEFRDQTGSDDKVPLALRRVETNKQGGKDLQVVIGADSTPTGKHAFAIGAAKLDPTAGSLGAISKKLVVRDSGNIGIGTEKPTQLVTFAGDKKTRLEIGKVSAGFPWGSVNPVNEGSFAINQQSKDSEVEGADFALMRDLKLRVVLGDVNTYVSSQDDGSVCILNKQGEPGESELMRVTAAGNVGIGTATPAARLDVAGRISRWSQDFSKAGIVSDGDELTVPSGTTIADWNIFVSPRLTQIEQPKSDDDAVLTLECRADPISNVKWRIKVGFKLKVASTPFSTEEKWSGGQANYLLVPR
jgi:hypothetical protein